MELCFFESEASLDASLSQSSEKKDNFLLNSVLVYEWAL